MPCIQLLSANSEYSSSAKFKCVLADCGLKHVDDAGHRLYMYNTILNGIDRTCIHSLQPLQRFGPEDLPQAVQNWAYTHTCTQNNSQ